MITQGQGNFRAAMMSSPPAPSSHELEVIRAPSRADPRHPDYATLFLAGTTTFTPSPSSSSSPAAGDWRGALCERLAGRRLTVYDPWRADWDASWREEAACAPFAEQAAWELARAEAADLVIFYFGPATDAPVSLLELGLAVGRRYASPAGRGGGAVVVCADPAYRKRGYVQMVCQRYGVELVHDFDELVRAVLRCLENVRE